MLGLDHLFDCCVAAYNEQQRQRNFEIYITDAAATLINMFAKDKHFPRYYEIMHPEEQDERSGEEIAADIMKRHGLRVVS